LEKEGKEGIMFKLSEEQEERARRLHKESIVVDGLGGATGLVVAEHYSPDMLKRVIEILDKLPREGPVALSPWPAAEEVERMRVEELISGRSDIEREWMELSGVDVFSMTVLAGQGLRFENALTGIALWQRKIDCLDYLVKATSFKDIERAKAQGKRAIIMNFQDTECLGRDLDKLQLVYDLGIRIIQLAYFLGNFVGSGCTERADGGVTLFGIEMIKRMNELGILVDLSHCGYRTTMDVIEISSAPVAVTHSFSRTVYDHPRGKTDDQIRALAAKNGYFGVLICPFFIRDLSQKEASIEDVLDHIDHVVGIMGVDKVGIGTDYPGPLPRPVAIRVTKRDSGLGFTEKEQPITAESVVQGFRDLREWPNVARGLISRGYKDDEIKGILGGNFLRIFKEVVG
jgi:membrane dipeptidase